MIAFFSPDTPLLVSSSLVFSLIATGLNLSTALTGSGGLGGVSSGLLISYVASFSELLKGLSRMVPGGGAVREFSSSDYLFI